jgi:hypothetical protein
MIRGSIAQFRAVAPLRDLPLASSEHSVDRIAGSI